MEDSSKSKILVIVSIVAIVSIVIAFDYISREKADENYVTTPEGDTIRKELEDDTDFFDYSIPDDYEFTKDNEKLQKYVDEIEALHPNPEDQEHKELWIADLAVIYDKPWPCETLEIQDIRDSCFYGVAIDTNDASLCDLIMFGREECYVLVAENTGDESLCEKARWSYDVCLQAGRTHNMTLCRQLGDYRGYCNDAAFPGCTNAEMEGCTDVGDSVPPGDISECENIPDFTKTCYYNVAIYHNKPSVCAKLEGEQKNSCYGNIGILYNNVNSCNLAGEHRDNCIAWVAFNTDDLSLCYEAGSEKDICIEDLYYKYNE